MASRGCLASRRQIVGKTVRIRVPVASRPIRFIAPIDGINRIKVLFKETPDRRREKVASHNANGMRAEY